MKNIKGRNGGTIKQSEPGDTGLPGAGRPKGENEPGGVPYVSFV